VLTVLTDRERQIMRLVSEGLSNKEIGRRLNIVDGTIKVHLHHIFQKLEISNRTVLAALAISHDDSVGVPPGNEVPRIRGG
jgi:two-component system nitrate/nitrite response regulator NarL